jgi:O-antigen/teichoic acid export membrane protein
LRCVRAPDNRTTRYLGGLAVGFANHVLTLLVGLWLTRFALSRVGQDGYGLWLVALQIMGYFTLADLGVVAVLPRQVAFALGRSGGTTRSVPGAPGPGAPAEAGTELPTLIAETARLVLWQMPIVLLGALVVWVAIPAAWAPLEPALAVVLVAFALGFPLRVFGAVLNGLQDLAFLGMAQLAVWTASTALIVTLLLGGHGISALAWGWALTQLLPPVIHAVRLAKRYPQAVPRRLPRLTLASAREHLSRALWVSLGQLASVLTTGIDLLVIGAVLGPAAVVPYACTAKLVQVAANVPYLISHTAGPALSEMRTGAGHERLLSVSTALSQAVLFAGGAIACVVTVINRGFVSWWVGPQLYGGLALTMLVVALMLIRHWGTTVVFAVYSFGHERRLALTGLAEGLVTAAATVVLVRVMGVVGAPVAALLGALTVTMPAVLPVLARETGASVGAVLAALAPWGARAALLIAAALAWQVVAPPQALPALVTAGLATAAAWTAIMAPLALQPPLRPYALAALDAVWPTRFGVAPWRRA